MIFKAIPNDSVQDYERLLDLQGSSRLDLPNKNFDTGGPTMAGDYFMADNACGLLLDDLSKENFNAVAPELRANLLDYYRDPAASNAVKSNARKWMRINRELIQLRNIAN